MESQENIDSTLHDFSAHKNDAADRSAKGQLCLFEDSVLEISVFDIE